MPASMRDVAALAGVSPRTVSNVVNDYVHVAPETRARVQRAIDKLDYRPSAAARHLRGSRTGLFALALPEISAPYFAELADLIERRASERGLTVLIDQTGGTRERELLVLDGYHSKVIDGLIFNPLSVTAHDLEARKLGFPTVLLGESVTASDIIHVSIDNVAGALTATQHLLGTGRTKIAAIGALPQARIAGPAQRRTEGYREALLRAGLGYEHQLVLPTARWSLAEGYRVAQQLLDGPADIDALFCFNDSLALGAMKAVTDRGLRIPEDIAVVGWDNIEDAAYSTPTLTTIAPNKTAIAHAAVDLLLDQLAGEHTATTEILLDYHLAVRQSA